MAGCALRTDPNSCAASAPYGIRGEKLSDDAVRLVRVGHEIVVSFIRDDGVLAVGQRFGHGFGRQPMRRAGGRAVILVADENQRRLFNLMQAGR